MIFAGLCGYSASLAQKLKGFVW